MSLYITSSLALKSDDNNVIIQVQNHLHVKLAAQYYQITRYIIHQSQAHMRYEKCIKFEYMYLPYSLYNVTAPHQGSDSGVE